MPALSRRDLLKAGFAAGVSFALPAPRSFAAANDRVGIGVIGLGGRGGEVSGFFSKLSGAAITAITDPDNDRVGEFSQRYRDAKPYGDLRKLLEDKSVDAVVVTTCNHWHCLAAIWAMQAGKHVYVEKPLSHSQWEGAQVVKASRKYDRIVQLGTQQRSDPMQAEIKKFLHEDKALGKIEFIEVVRYGVRESIGKRATPLEIPKSINYDLWLGPAQDLPVFREKLHYDWHWDWNTGSGEMGNWGVHVLDDARNNGLLDEPRMPKKVMAGGGRFVWNDAGETPNVHFAYYDTGSVPVLLGLSNLPAAPGAKDSLNFRGAKSGYVVHCEGGYFSGQRGKGTAYDKGGKKIRDFKGDSGQGHQQNFLDALAKNDRKVLNAEIALGNDSSGWCNLANIAYRAGGDFGRPKAEEMRRGYKPWSDLLDQMQEHLANHGVAMDAKSVRLSSVLELDKEGEKFVGEGAEAANRHLKREYRKGYEVPEIG
jgi:predicted dehydrogenase